MPKMVNFKTVKQCYQTGQFYKDKNWWKMPKLNNSNATFWVIFKHCECAKNVNVACYAGNVNVARYA